MTENLLIFTFSPVQSFIAEARRAADMYTGSQILVELSRAAALSIGWDNIIYPASKEDIPNRLVARIPAQAEQVAVKAKEALLARWKEIAESAIDGKSDFKTCLPQSDPVWAEIWTRQTAPEYLWEIFWATSEIKGNSPEAYGNAYQRAEQLLLAEKFNRAFIQVEEPGFPDTLSGTREALHPKGENGKQFWAGETIARSELVPVRIRPNGQERLDAFGLIKRFSSVTRQKRVEPFNHFPSTSSVASADFLETVKDLSELSAYQQAVTAILANYKYEVRKRGESTWLFDGDLFYPETLTAQRLEKDYGITLGSEDKRLAAANLKLNQLYTAAAELKRAQSAGAALRAKPSPYYAIIMLDGDGMGDQIKACQNADEHQTLSRQIADFSAEVKAIVRRNFGAVVYNGGDDVLVMAPLSTAFKLAQELAETFKTKTGGKVSASAGIAITHHTSPLGAALRAAHEAEHAAKQVTGKAAVCVYLLKRSGEPVQMLSKWEALKDPNQNDLFETSVDYFAGDWLSSKFAYEVIGEAYAGSAQVAEARKALLKRLVKRHKSGKLQPVQEAKFVENLLAWLLALDQSTPKLKAESQEVPQGMAELGKWLSFARFVAQGGEA